MSAAVKFHGDSGPSAADHRGAVGANSPQSGASHLPTTEPAGSSRVALLEDRAAAQLRRLPALSGADDVTGDPYHLACAMVTDAWEPALARSFHLGREEGYAAGYAQCEADYAARWSAVYRKVKPVLELPTRAELKRRRGEA